MVPFELSAVSPSSKGKHDVAEHCVALVHTYSLHKDWCNRLEAMRKVQMSFRKRRQMSTYLSTAVREHVEQHRRCC